MLVHGFLGSSGVWAPVQSILQKSFNVIAVDLPGFAASAGTPVRADIADYSRALVDFLEQLGVERFSLVGWSFGGIVSQQVAISHSRRLERLVLHGTTAVGRLPHRFESWEQTKRRIELEGIAPVTNRTVASWFVDGERHPYFARCLASCQGASPSGALKAIDAISQWNAVSRLGRIETPTLVVVGDRDRSTPLSDSVVLHKGISESSLCVLPRCAHGAHMEKPHLFAAVLRDFLPQMSGSPSSRTLLKARLKRK